MKASRVTGIAAMALALGVAGVMTVGAGKPAEPASGGFTRAQATRGQFVYIQYCLVCHGAHLEGGAGPPLVGPRFGKSMTRGKMTTPALFDFVRSAMPMNAPGSLRQAQYFDVLAYLLERNAYNPGAAQLSARTLASVRLLPYPGLAPPPAPNAGLLAYATPGRQSTVPAAAKVDLDDAALRGAGGDAGDWLLPGRTYDNWRYSPLHQIDASDVGALQLVKLVHTGMIGSFETTPLVAGRVMYLTTPAVEGHMKIMALDAVTGNTIWSTMRTLGPYKGCCGPNNRGAALAYGNLYVATLDAKLVALDARSGRERWETQVADTAPGYSETMAPQVCDGLVIVGSAGGEWALRGFVAAYDARTGKQRWRWYSTDPKTFAGDSWKTGGGTVWTTPAIDAQRGLAIFGTGNPNPDMDGSRRAGDNRYTDSIVALDVKTGALRWYYQEVKHDLWDYDATSNIVLFDVRVGGRTIPAAGQAGKVGWYYIVDRRTGKLLVRSQPFVTQNANMFKVHAVLPGANGGAEWSPPAYSPRTHLVYVLGINQLMDFTTKGPGDHPGIIRTGSGFTNSEKPNVQTGTFTALDVDTGKIAWQYHAAKPMIGGALATAGDLVFVGEGDGSLDAFDARSGKKLWSYTFVSGVNAPPVSYEVGGTQYVAVAAGGNYQLGYEVGDAIGIFKLKR